MRTIFTIFAFINTSDNNKWGGGGGGGRDIKRVVWKKDKEEV